MSESATFPARLRKVGNEYEVTVPEAVVIRLGLKEGQLLAVEVQPAKIAPELRQELQEAFEASWAANEATYRQLADS